MSAEVLWPTQNIASTCRLIFLEDHATAFPWTLSGESPLRDQPLLVPGATALSPFNPQVIKTPCDWPLLLAKGLNLHQWLSRPTLPDSEHLKKGTELMPRLTVKFTTVQQFPVKKGCWVIHTKAIK